MPNTTLSLESAYARLGIRVTKTGGDSVVPIAEAGANTTWSDQEMHDAMEAHFDAGATHVCSQPLSPDQERPLALDWDALEALSPNA